MKKIQKFGIASTLIAALPAGAMAADLPSRGAAPLPVFTAPAMGWTGFYVGAQVGAVASNARINGNAIGYGTWTGPNGSPTQVTAGILAGYDRQMGNLVFGVLADVNARFGSAEGASYYGPAISTGWRTSSNWDASLRLRLGFLATDRALIYATGGLIAANYKLDNPSCPACAVWDSANLHKGTRIGWTIGTGVEYKLDQSWSMKMEYLYADLGRKTTAINGGEDYYIRSRITSHTVRVGLNYKFGGAAGPVIASY